MGRNTDTRTLVLWIPDWPVRAHADAEGISGGSPLAVVDHGLVFACSPSAREEGVRRGQRIREAQAACPDLLALDYDASLDHRSFEAVIAAVEALMPGVQLVRPGTCVLRARGPARYYGGEDRVGQKLLDTLSVLGLAGGLGDMGTLDARIAIADGRFAAEQAARMPGGPSIRIIPPGGSPAFLAPHPIEALADKPLTTLLRRLGMPTLGDFAALDFHDVRSRFGEAGAYAHTRASGTDGRQVIPRLPPRLRDVEVSFEPPLDRVDQITFAFRTAAERFIDELTQSLLVCTALRVEVRTENGAVSERVWGHPRWFSATDVLDRIRWQVQSSGKLDSAVTRVRVLPESLDGIGSHERGLWGSAPDDNVHHGLSRVQSLLGHEGVSTASIGGGRGVRERQVLTPWGDRAVAGGGGGASAGGGRGAGAGAASGKTAGTAAGASSNSAARPWPGSVPLPAPSTVFEKPLAVTVRGQRGEPVTVTERGMLTGTPAGFAPEPEVPVDRLLPLSGWAGPWPVNERWWSEDEARSFHRFQVVDSHGTAWLLAMHDTEWWAEAKYD